MSDLHSPYSGPVKSNARYRKVNATLGILLAVILFLLVIFISLIALSGNEEGTSGPVLSITYKEYTYETIPPEPPAETAVTESAELSFVGPMPLLIEAPSISVFVPNEDVAKGDLILINGDHPYVFPKDQKLTVFYGNRSPAYTLSNASLSVDADLFPIFDGMLVDFAAATGCKEVLITSGYRSLKDQQKILDDRIRTMGAEKAALYVADPGHSEHHSGLAVDMVIFTGGRQYYFPDHEAGSWIIENAPKYGFILRYTEEMAAITGCAAEPWHYRYVGAPHAQLITDMGLCYEQYVEYLRQFTWKDDRLFIRPDGTTFVDDGFSLPEDGYMVYYIEADREESTTEIPLPPETQSYKISGDNVGGFFVTVSFS